MYLVVFARKKNATIWANEFRGDAGWSGWKTWGKPPAKLGGVTGAKYSPDACSWGGKRLDLFTSGVDSQLWHKWIDNKGVIHEWELLGGRLSSSPTATAFVTWGRIDVCARFTDKKIYVNTLLDGHTPAGKWSGWKLLRESILSDSGPDACSMAGYLEVFTQHENDYQIYSTWTGVKNWMMLPGPAAPKKIMSDPSAVAWSMGNVSVFVRGEDNALWVRTRIFDPYKGSKLLDWQSWGGALNSGPDACYSEGRRIDVFARGADNTMLHMHRNDVELPDVVVSEPIDDEHDWDSDPSAVAMFPDAHPFPKRPITWEASESGIEIEPGGKGWNAGRVMDVLVWQYRDNPAPAAYDEILIGAAHSGVWWIPSGTGYALPLSKDWDNPNVTCLAFGPDAEDHFFAGCGNANWGSPDWGGALYETILSSGTPLHNSRKIPLKKEIGSITDIVVLKDVRMGGRPLLVLACWGGLYWSRIPAPAAADKYVWKKADWKDAGISGAGPACYGVTYGLNKDTKKEISLIVAGAWDIKDPSIRGIFVGTWIRSSDPKEPLKLSMKRTNINLGSNIDTAQMKRVSVASCEKYPEYVYALSVDDGGTPNAVLKSTNGGQDWTQCSENVVGDAVVDPVVDPKFRSIKRGDNASGGLIHHINVSPTNSKAVGFGITDPLVSFDAGTSWRWLYALDEANPERHLHTHTDIHCVYFDPVMAGRLFIASDGGLISTTDNGKSFWSYYNKYLYNLLFLGTTAREFYGRLSSSYALRVIGGGLQDNGDVYLTDRGWRRLTGGDGGQMLSILEHDFVYNYMNDPTPHRATFNAAKGVLEDQGPIPIKATDGVTKLAGSIPSVPYNMEIVKIPRYKRTIWSGEVGSVPVERSMYAVGATATDVPGCGGVKAFGLFANTDGSDTHWEPIINPTWTAESGHIVTAVSTANGNRVFLATTHWPDPSSSQLYVFSPSTGSWSNVTGGLPTTLPKGGSFSRIVVEDGDTIAYVAYNVGSDLAHPNGLGFLLRTDNGGTDWKKVAGVPEEIICGMDEDWSDTEDEWITRPKPLYLATDSSVLVTKDEGRTWEDISEGLPTTPHCMDLRFFIHSDRARYLYLGTWGWSLWTAQLPSLWVTYPH